MIATEEAAEGIRMPFCNRVVNDDLPWSPQRIGTRLRTEMHRLILGHQVQKHLQRRILNGSGKCSKRTGLSTALPRVKRSVYEYIVHESKVDCEFPKRLNEREDIRPSVKLLGGFEVDAPVGKYNQDWAIVNTMT
jgi:hypothetical protein